LEAGFDRGITKLIAVSDGTFVENPRFYENAQAELRRSQRRVARRVKGSNRRRKAVVLLGKLHKHVANCRGDFLHKETTKAVDAAWSMWKRFTSYKAEEAGRAIGIVPPQYTSQECGHNGCMCVDKRNRKGEKFCCIKCGFTEHADTHGAKRVLARSKLARTEPSGANVG
jgi:putative transposase